MRFTFDIPADETIWTLGDRTTPSVEVDAVEYVREAALGKRAKFIKAREGGTFHEVQCPDEDSAMHFKLAASQAWHLMKKVT